MPAPPQLPALASALAALEPHDANFAVDFVSSVLRAATEMPASDVHLQPTAGGLLVQFRLDGVLQTVGEFAIGERTDPVTRLKVLAGLLTYRQDAPQEGRILEGFAGVEMRVSTFPTMRGERAVVRLFARDAAPWQLADLGLPPDVQARWQSLLRAPTGGLVVSGPAGSGKTTTGYASLRQIVHDTQAGRCVLSMEDPCEMELEGVGQSQVNLAAELTLATGLRSLLRQDPEVIFLGEMRDPETARIAFQAALTGQLMLTTFHAGSASETLDRLTDMGIEAYALRSGLLGILSQRLLRRLCACREPVDDPADHLGWPVDRSWRAVGCAACHHTGYRGRVVAAELIVRDNPRSTPEPAATPNAAAWKAAPSVQLQERIRTLIEAGDTSPAEARRCWGPMAT